MKKLVDAEMDGAAMTKQVDTLKRTLRKIERVGRTRNGRLPEWSSADQWSTQWATSHTVDNNITLTFRFYKTTVERKNGFRCTDRRTVESFQKNGTETKRNVNVILLSTVDVNHPDLGRTCPVLPAYVPLSRSHSTMSHF